MDDSALGRAPGRAPGRPIVVGVDGSEEGAAALDWAADEAQRRGRPLRLVHVAQPWGSTAAVELNPELAAVTRRAEQDLLDTAVSQVRALVPDVAVDGDLEDGQASDVLLRRTRDAELLVLGSRGRGGFAGMLLGSTSLQVAMHARCPVVVLRSAGEGGRDGRSIGRVVVGVDGSRHSAAATTFAFQEAALRGVGVTAVHTWLIPDFDIEALPAQEWEQVEKNERARLTEDLHVWRSRFPDVDLTEKVVRGAPAAALLAESAGAELLAVGSHGRGGFGGLVLGSVSHAVLHHAHSPVVVVRS